MNECFTRTIFNTSVYARNMIIFYWVLLTSVLRALFKDFKFRNYSLKKYNVSISDVLNAQVSTKTYIDNIVKHLKILD